MPRHVARSTTTASCAAARAYSVFQLGAISADLSALAGFFPDGWSRPPVNGDLTEAERSWLIAEVAFCLMSLGRLDEALGPRRMDREMDREAGDWNNFCIASHNLVDLLTPLGQWREAEAVAREAVDAARRVADAAEARQRRLAALAYVGRALHGQGRLADAARAFAEAEAVQAGQSRQLPTLVGLRGFDYAQLLLEQARTTADRDAVLARARASLAYASEKGHLRSIALDHCTIGQAVAWPPGPGTDAAAARDATAALDRAVETMRRASGMDDMPKLHLTRAHHRRTQGDPAGARADLDAALVIAEPAGMRTDLAEAALLAGHLALDAPAPEHIADAAGHWTEADRLIRDTGYGRREAELHLLEARLKHHQRRPDEAREALASADARLRAIGQWGLWPQLAQVAEELGLPPPAMD
jgi:tetratricopeptide (TPR) repeat protein